MDWKSPFVIYRINPDSTVEEVFQAEDLKKAKYWLTYIAQAGDVLCKTPLHPKHSKQTSKPEYWSHKEKSGKLGSDESQWRDTMKQHGELTFPGE
jgi:hypothetical protein